MSDSVRIRWIEEGELVFLMFQVIVVTFQKINDMQDVRYVIVTKKEYIQYLIR